VGRGQYTGLLPALFRYAEHSLTGGIARPIGGGSTTAAAVGAAGAAPACCRVSGERDVALDVGLAFVTQATATTTMAAAATPAAAEAAEMGGGGGGGEEQQPPSGQGGGSGGCSQREQELLWLEGVLGLLAAVVSVQVMHLFCLHGPWLLLFLLGFHQQSGGLGIDSVGGLVSYMFGGPCLLAAVVSVQAKIGAAAEHANLSLIHI